MISHINGKVIHRNDKFLVIDVGGVGYKIFGTGELISMTKEGQEVSVWTYLAVRENAMDLYGFKNKEESDFFELLITVSGIGPKTALNILNLAAISSLRKAIATGETAHLTKVSGIGKKMADKIVLELKGKLIASEETTHGIKEEVDALEALKSLGYSHKEARDALKEIDPDIKETGAKVKATLKILGR